MTPPATPATRLFIDADACPVKDEVYRVAERYGLQVFVVSNGWINTRRAPWIEQVVVDAGPDIADDWIAERAVTGDIVITSDIPLADRCLKAGAQAMKPNGQPFTPDSIGSALAGRLVGEHMRSMGLPTSGPPPFGPKDRSAFLQALDTAVVRARRSVP
ncbi:YaiI/YqxD family protein [uncultured Brevundimonas sp.]|uniref:YaiI/YqxD family protein n=1 Tax=uncultured Brevundimonas sp. TaxID=213418 RepID=UPI0030ECF04F|tara:strand:+ start:20885 stop:21361 length:477 start_codon:yes stop_codon:yes gene_type:complete